MANEVAKRDKTPAKKSDALYYGLACVAVIFALVVVPKIFGALGLSFLAPSAGLNKLLSVGCAVALGWICIKPSKGYADFVELAKGAQTEWRKTIKPDRDKVVQTTMMVLVLVFVFAILILILDWFFGMIVRAIVG